MKRPRSKSARFVWLLATVFLVAAIAGCMDDAGDDDQDDRNGDDDVNGAGDPSPGDGDDPFEPTPPPQPPQPDMIVHAGLVIEEQVVWSGAQVNFSGEESGVLEGEVVAYVFDPGDGNTTELDASQEPVFTHTYEEGGIYIANLTVVAEGENESAEDTASVGVFVQERHELSADELDAGYLILAEEEEHEHAFVTRFGASFFALTLEVEDDSLVGDASGEVRFVGPDDEELASAEIDGDATVELDGMFNLSAPEGSGDHTLHVMLEEGEIEYSGEVTIFYGIDPEQHDLD